ncbi:hypothetical protein L1887_04811 [Cichorium endivia]|nr:hypothetical protein L1887_04811 [Cichorium endivia]
MVGVASGRSGNFQSVNQVCFDGETVNLECFIDSRNRDSLTRVLLSVELLSIPQFGTDMIPTVAGVQTSSMKAHEGSDEIIVDQNPYDAVIPTACGSESEYQADVSLNCLILSLMRGIGV